VAMEMMLTFCCWHGELARQSIGDFRLVTLPSSKDQEEDVQPTTSHASLHRRHSAMDKKHTRSSSWTQTSPYATRHMRRDMWGVLVCSWTFFVFARHGQVDMGGYTQVYSQLLHLVWFTVLHDCLILYPTFGWQRMRPKAVEIHIHHVWLV
jgi:hypothetical protein